MVRSLWLGAAGSLALAACATVRPLVDGGEVRNMTTSAIHSVRVVFQPTRRSAFVNEILPGRGLTLEFVTREMKADYADFTWRNSSGRECSARVDAPRCPADRAEETMWVVYSISADDTVTVKLVPEK